MFQLKPTAIAAVRSAALVAAVLTPALAGAQTSFTSGQTRVSVSAGNTRAYNDNYFQIGLGAGYYVLDGLEIGLDASSWLGGETRIHEVMPSATYVFSGLEKFAPYAGAFYRHTSIENRDSVGAYGARGGVLLQQTPNLHVRAGVAVIRYRNCEQTMGADCTDYFPELSAGFYF